MPRKLLFLVTSLVATTYATIVAADDLSASVILEFHRGYENRGTIFEGAPRQQYAVVDANGLSATIAATFTSFSRDAFRTRRYQAGRRLSINAVTTYAHIDIGGSGETRRCDALARFTPLAGHTYNVTQVELSLGNCDLQVFDTATGRSPDGLDVSNHAGISGR